ncbi:Mediator of RNA polymerase II transcription subunit 16 [Lecanora helva]
MQKTAAEGWVFKCSQRKLLGPHNLSQRPGLVTVTKAGMIKVLSMNQSGQWQDFKAEIDNIGAPDEILTHAAICPEKIADKSTTNQGNQDSAILIATYNNKRDLRVYSVTIDFGRSKIHGRHVKVYNQFSPLTVNDGTMTNGDILLKGHQLSLLELVPPGPKSGTRDSNPPFVFASFVHASDGFDSAAGQASQSTILCKLELQLISPKVHSSFESLSYKKNISSSNVDLPVGPMDVIVR